MYLLREHSETGFGSVCVFEEPGKGANETDH